MLSEHCRHTLLAFVHQSIAQKGLARVQELGPEAYFQAMSSTEGLQVNDPAYHICGELADNPEEAHRLIRQAMELET